MEWYVVTIALHILWSEVGLYAYHSLGTACETKTSRWGRRDGEQRAARRRECDSMAAAVASFATDTLTAEGDLPLEPAAVCGSGSAEKRARCGARGRTQRGCVDAGLVGCHSASDAATRRQGVLAGPSLPSRRRTAVWLPESHCRSGGCAD